MKVAATTSPMAAAAPPVTQVGLTALPPQLFDSALAGLDVIPDADESFRSTEHDQLDAALAGVAQESIQVPLEVALDVAVSVVDSSAPGPNRKLSSFYTAKNM